MSEARRTYSITQAAQILGYGKSTLYDHLSDEGIDLGCGVTLRVIRIGSKVVVPDAEIDRVLGSRSVAS